MFSLKFQLHINTTWHQDLKNVVTVIVLLWNDYHADMTTINNNSTLSSVAIIWTEKLTTFLNLQSPFIPTTKSWLWTRFCNQGAAYYLLYAGNSHPYSAHNSLHTQTLLHVHTFENEQVNLCWTWVTHVTHKAVKTALVLRYTDYVTGSKHYDWNICNFLTLHM
jgi:hypothetical protein